MEKQITYGLTYRRNRRLTFAASFVLPLALSLTALAQQPAASPGTQLPENAPGPAAPPAPAAAGEATTERVVVTGSYIPSAEEVTASPLDTLTAQEINRSGSSEILGALQKRNPDFQGAGNIGISNANTAATGTHGGATITIRGFPTLVLYEGRRIADAAAISTGGLQFTDVALFPAALISRIEVLKDGASALYGSEAVGGVVNIFTKDDYQGAEAGFRYGTVLDGAVAERRLYAIGGIGNGTTSVTAGMQYYEIDPLFERQRSYSNPSINLTTTYGGSVRDNHSRYLPIGFTPIQYPGNPVANSPFDVGATPGSIAPGVGYAALPQYYRTASTTEVLTYNIGQVPTSTLDTSRTNVLASVNHQVFGKQLELFANFLYSNADYRSVLNAQPLSNATGVVILGTTRVDPQTGALVPEDRGAPAPFNPFRESIDAFSTSGPFRLIAANRYQIRPRFTDTENNFYRFLGGVRSQITENWMFETAAYYSKYDINYVNTGLVNAPQLNAMIAGTAKDASGNPIPALDFFALNPIGTNPGQVTPAQFDTVFGGNFRALSSYQRVIDAKIVGFPFELSGGKVGLSVGIEYRQEGFKVSDSPEIFIGSVPIGNIDTNRDITSEFAEVSIPIVGSSMHVPFVYNLELGLAGRHDHYEGVAKDAWVPKITLRYQPIKDLTLRATYSNSFIAPNLYQTNGPSISAFSTTITLNGVTQDQAQVLSESNPNLVPSTAETYTAGLVYSPSWLPGFVLSADYFRTLEQNIVAFYGGALILGNVNDLGPASPYANLVAFGAFPGRPGARAITAPGQLQGNLSSVFYIDQLQNLGAARTEGFDLSARYNLDLHTWGQLEFGLNAVVFTKADLKTLPFHSSYYNILNLDFPEAGGLQSDYKLTGLLEYRWHDFTVSLVANYIPEALNAVGANPEFEDQSTYDKIDDFFTVDGRLSYTFVRKQSPPAAAIETKDYKSTQGGKDANAGSTVVTGSVIDKLLDGLTLAVGCNNMFDKQPPFISGANSNSDLSVYDPYGRFVYFEISKKF